MYVSMSVTYAFSHQYRSHFTRLPRQMNGCWWSIPRWVDSWPEGWANGEACTIFSYCMNVGKTVPPLKGLYLHTDIEHSDCNFKKIDGLVAAPFCKKSFLWHRCVRRPLILIYLGFSFATEQETLLWIDINVK